MGYIYKITNKINNKMYIGQTSLSIEQRWKQHIKRAQEKTRHEHFINALRKWGKENFIIETIEEVPDKQLNAREQYWIAYYNTYFGEGYNSTIGGEGRILYNRDEILSLWQQGLTVTEISVHLNCKTITISNVLHARGITHEEIVKRGNAISGNKNKKPVKQYDLNGNFICEYPDAIEAARIINCDDDGIRTACRGGLFSNGFFWKYSENLEDIVTLIQQYQYNLCLNNCRSVDQYDLFGTYIKTWRSLTDAAKFYNCSVTNIERSCKKYREASCGYLWTFSDSGSDMAQRGKNYQNKVDPRAMPVDQYTLSGVYIKSYESISAAARELNVDKTALQKALRNHYTSFNFIWILPEEGEWIPYIINRHEHKHDCKKKVVYQYALDGTYIQSFPSAKDACIAMGLDPNKKRSLSRNCQGYQKTFNGYVWSYNKP